MIGDFTYNGKSASSMGLNICNKNVWCSPSRSVTAVSVPGRSGDILVDNGRYENINVVYSCFGINSGYDVLHTSRSIKAWLQAHDTNYYHLTDTYDPHYFRLASYSGTLDIEAVINQLKDVKLTFNCKPFKYSFDGQQEIELTKPVTLYNDEEWESHPYIRIYGKGTIVLMINNASFSFSAVDEYIELDSILMSAYKGIELCNHQIHFYDFPILVVGKNKINWSGNVSKVCIIPRWCCL